MNDLFAVGDAYVTELSELKTKEKARKDSATHPPAKRKKSEALRETQPWV